jgi:hypothetical protein
VILWKVRNFLAYRAVAHSAVVFAAWASEACVPELLTHGSDGDDASDVWAPTPDDGARGGGECDAGNPGACAAGVLVADGGEVSCHPQVSAQPCYSADAKTNGVGPCHGGTQSCIGSLGPCNGEVAPAQVEDCFNTIDDDCDGVVNNGCPSSLSLGPDRTLAQVGDDGGAPKSAHCPPGAFVTRVDSWGDATNHHGSGVSIYCATPTLVKGASSYSVTLAQVTPAPYLKVTGSTTPTDDRQDDCGLTGLVAITYAVGTADIYIEGLGNHCGTSAVTLQADNSITFDFKGTGDKTFKSWSTAGTPFDLACQPNEVVVGFALREGSWLNSITPICAVLSVVYT